MPTISREEAIRMGIPHKNIQTILIPRVHKLVDQREWLKKEGYVHSNYRHTANFTRWLQNFPIRGAKYNTITLPNDVELVYQEW